MRSTDYLDRLTSTHVARGLSPDKARRAAQLDLGSALRVREEVRSYGWENRFETLIGDFKYAIRSLCSTPGFTIVVVLTLALGIGANTAIFSVVDAALIRPLPYREPDRIWTLAQTRSLDIEDSRSWNASYPDFLDWHRQSKSFESLAGFNFDGAVLRGQGDPSRWSARR